MTEYGYQLNKFTKADFKTRSFSEDHFWMHQSDDFIDELGDGAESWVSRVSFPFGNKSVDLAFKQCSSGNAVHSLAAWIQLRQAKISVPATMRVVGEKGNYQGVVMTDLTHNWRDILISSNATKEHILSWVNTVTPETVQKFVAFDIKNSDFQEHLNEELRGIAEKAAKRRIQFAGKDILSGVFSHTGDFRLVISDMGRINLNVRQDPEALYQNNLQYTDAFHLPLNVIWEMAKTF